MPTPLPTPLPAPLPADTIAPAVLHAAFEAAFADYLIGPFRVAPADWPALLARQAIALAPSRVVVDGERVVAFAFVALRDAHHWRLATMGALPEARGSGVAPALLDELIARAAAAGVETLELEVFAQNERALRLYRSRGFEPRHELHGYVLEAADAPADAAADAPDRTVEVVDRAAAMAWLDDASRRIADLPLQVTPACLATLAAPLQAWRCGGAQIVFDTGTETTSSVRIHSLVDTDPEQRDAAVLVGALCRRFAGRRVAVPQLQRLDVSGAALRAAGFAPLPLHQLLMVRRLSPPSSP
jgi:ribosomal protein S18 acetylase RimI-like enzyme